MDDQPARVGTRHIRIERPLPAPVMDGFDVRQFVVGREYIADERIARYLIVAGYAVAIDRDRPRRPEN